MEQRRANDILKIVGFDPAMRNWGVARGTFYIPEERIELDDLMVITTETRKDKTVRMNSTDLDAAQILSAGVIGAVRGAQAIFVEVPVGSQSAAAMKGYGICLGILGALRAAGKPFFLVTPDEVKQVTGIKNATKQQMIDWAIGEHSNLAWPTQTRKGVTSVVAGTAEHMADAVACIHAGINSQPFKQLLAIMKAGQ